MAKIIEKPKVHRPRIKTDKLDRICSIYWADAESDVTPEEFKETLNMFRGRQLRAHIDEETTVLQECLKYLHLSLAKQQGDVNAEKEMSNIHKKWNNYETED